MCTSLVHSHSSKPNNIFILKCRGFEKFITQIYISLDTGGKKLIGCATYAAVLQKHSIKVVEKLGKKNRVYVAILREPQPILYIFFDKIPPSFI